MSKAAASRHTTGMALAAAAVLLTDRLTKRAALESLSGRAPIRYLGGALELVLSENSGGFLSLGGGLPPAVRHFVFVLLVGVALIAGSVWLLRSSSMRVPRSIAVAMIIAGGASNLVDRLVRGRVVDFVIVRAGSLHTGIFNLADAAIFGGAFLFIWPAFRRERPKGGIRETKPDHDTVRRPRTRGGDADRAAGARAPRR